MQWVPSTVLGTRDADSYIQWGKQTAIHVHKWICTLLLSIKRNRVSEWNLLSRVRLSATPQTPGQNTGVGRLFLLQGVFPTQGLNPALLHRRRFFTSWASREAPTNYRDANPGGWPDRQGLGVPPVSRPRIPGEGGDVPPGAAPKPAQSRTEVLEAAAGGEEMRSGRRKPGPRPLAFLVCFFITVSLVQHSFGRFLLSSLFSFLSTQFN